MVAGGGMSSGARVAFRGDITVLIHPARKPKPDSSSAAQKQQESAVANTEETTHRCKQFDLSS